MTGVEIFIYGFDSGVGLPKPKDFRDQPNMWFEGQLPMKQDYLKQKLQKSSLRLGLVEDTLQDFLREDFAPVAFLSFDFDIYTSTRDAFAILDAPYEQLLPRIICYFDDLFGHTYNDYCGERLAISEYNCRSILCKLSPIYGLRYFVPTRFRSAMYWDAMYYAHLFYHPCYNALDSFRKAVYTDEYGKTIRVPPDSDWKSQM
jgi:hypothetical protein